LILFEVGLSAVQGSWWAILAGSGCGILVVIRTLLEDRTLQADLPGYREYAGRVKYRLIPGIW
jgi:protein-S-isoprenylcysteine O-methyltransferase Ste14